MLRWCWIRKPLCPYGVLMSCDENWRRVGEKIRHLRIAQGLTIRQLAAEASLSANGISLVERGSVAPSVATLCRIAAALGAPPASFFEEACGKQAAPPPAAAEARAADSELTPVPLPADPGACFDARRAPGTGCNQRTICICGGIQYETLAERIQLATGDSLVCDSEILHRWCNPGDQPAVLVIVISPPGLEPR